MNWLFLWPVIDLACMSLLMSTFCNADHLLAAEVALSSKVDEAQDIGAQSLCEEPRQIRHLDVCAFPQKKLSGWNLD